MIAFLAGSVAAAGLGEVVLDVGGVGYRVLVAPGTVSGGLGETLTLHTHLSVREDALTLYGFATPSARGLFTTLLGVTGVGPKLALAAIGTLGAEGLRRAVVTEDVAALTVVPGVGKKGAQRMILELRERLGATGDALPGGGTAMGDARAEVRDALAGLGYGASEVAAALEGVPDDAEVTPEELLRQTLRALGGRR